MAGNNVTINFSLLRIKTEQFAIFEDKFDKSEVVNLNTNLSFGSISVISTLSFGVRELDNFRAVYTPPKPPPTMQILEDVAVSTFPENSEVGLEKRHFVVKEDFLMTGFLETRALTVKRNMIKDTVT